MTETIKTKVLMIGAGTSTGYGQLGLDTPPQTPLIPANAGTQCFG